MNTSTKGWALERGAEFSLSKEEYSFLLQGGYLPRITQDSDLIGFYVEVDSLLFVLKDDYGYTEEPEEKEILKALIGKFEPMKGKTVFIS